MGRNGTVVEVARKCTEETDRGKGENLGGGRQTWDAQVEQGTAVTHNLTEDMLPLENMELLSYGTAGSKAESKGTSCARAFDPRIMRRWVNGWILGSEGGFRTSI